VKLLFKLTGLLGYIVFRETVRIKFGKFFGFFDQGFFGKPCGPAYLSGGQYEQAQYKNFI